MQILMTIVLALTVLLCLVCDGWAFLTNQEREAFLFWIVTRRWVPDWIACSDLFVHFFSANICCPPIVDETDPLTEFPFLEEISHVH